MIDRVFHRWERRLASVDTNRVVRPFEWGLDWLDPDVTPGDISGGESARGNFAIGAAESRVLDWGRAALADSDAFYRSAPPRDAAVDAAGTLTFSSQLRTPFPANNQVTARIYHARRPRPAADQPIVIVLPQWNSDAGGHVGLCQLFARFGISAVRLSLPYHDVRKPPELERADFIVSANVGRTLHANRQAVLDAKGVVDWLWAQGYRRIGIMGTSLGSCLSMITMAHDERIRAGAFNHVSTYFADVVWRGLSTRHVREGLESAITLDRLRDVWMPISPWPFIDRIRGRRALLVYALWDLTFPLDLSKHFVNEFARRDVAHERRVLPCGHYTTGKAPFKFVDAYYLTRFFKTRL